jgi:hypothetical protein
VQIERQMNNTVVIQWTSPDGIPSKHIKGYVIYVDGEYKETVMGSARTKALISDLNTDKVNKCVLLFYTLLAF